MDDHLAQHGAAGKTDVAVSQQQGRIGRGFPEAKGGFATRRRAEPGIACKMLLLMHSVWIFPPLRV